MAPCNFRLCPLRVMVNSTWAKIRVGVNPMIENFKLSHLGARGGTFIFRFWPLNPTLYPQINPFFFYGRCVRCSETWATIRVESTNSPLYTADSPLHLRTVVAQPSIVVTCGGVGGGWFFVWSFVVLFLSCRVLFCSCCMCVCVWPVALLAPELYLLHLKQIFFFCGRCERYSGTWATIRVEKTS